MSSGKKTVASPPRVAGRLVRHLTWWNVAFFAAGLGLAVVVHEAVKLFGGRQEAPTPGPESTARAPWGHLEATPLILERPEEFFHQDVPPQQIRWVLGGHSAAQWQSLIEGCGLNEQHRALLLDPSHWQATADGIVATPPLEVVREMEPAPRGRIYSVLARTQDNLAQRFPFVFRGRFEDWFQGCDLAAERLAQVRRMLYGGDGVLRFADLSFFQLTAPTNEVRTLVRFLTRVPTLLLKLHVDEHSNVADLLRYWGAAGPASDFKPLLESMARTPGGASLNVSYFMPPVPRLLLYGFPRPQAAVYSRPPDCVWTALNFFNAQPDDRFFDPQHANQVLASQYRRIPAAGALGDILMLHEPGPAGTVQLVHMCVYVADEVVFTKNGGDIYQPWILMRLPDMLALFPSDPPPQISVFRRVQAGTAPILPGT